MIRLTSQYADGPKARAVPDAYYSREAKSWVIDDPTPRGAVVALKLFPGLEHDHPELLELRTALLRDVRPVDHATRMGLRIKAPRVRAAMAERGWSLSRSKAEAIGVGADYQEVDLGYAHAILNAHGGFYLGWARGLGKTLGTAALIDERDAQRTLIVAPNTGKQTTWAAELAWATPWLRVITLPNAKAKREACLREVKYLAKEGEPFVLVVHYEALALIAGISHRLPKSEADLRPDWPRVLSTYERGRLPVERADGYKGPLAGDKAKYKREMGNGWKQLVPEWDLAVLDEGHRIANPDALQSRAARKIPAAARLVLSGSVVQNDWEEPYGPLKYLYPKRYKAKWRDWNDRFLDYVENGYGRTCVGVLEGQEQALREELGVFMVIRDKESKTEDRIELVEMSAGQRAAYDDLVDSCLTQLDDGTRVKAEVGIAMLTRLRQVATGLDTLSMELRDSSKLDRCIEVIQRDMLRGDDFAVFAWYKASAYALAQRLTDLGIGNFTITGDVKHEDRAQMIADFQAGEGRVMIGTISTMGESVNLQRANHVIRIDRSFNPALNLQVVDRVDRQGQARPVYLTDIVAKGTVDELVVMPNLANKEAIRTMILGGQS